ncbi:hypothetical protein [Pseudomonas marginalis]|uniref:hypothetical protein n=1 Tax=Pseudomonas marginalis TaxID=298 RepID=UPI0011B6E620|nr:hypothetical protein [Pseudomonas marginalis]KAA8555174.1 hypothetical protein FX984_01792 [Pseudomonas marginalis]TWR71923.1 hypothetical protein FIV40_09480 [Pseudomonas marginalis]
MKKAEIATLPPKIEIAMKAGQIAADACTNDGGSANCDRVVIRMPGVRAAWVEGLRGYLQEAHGWHARGFHLDAPFAGIGNRRYAGVQAMYESLKNQGVDCYVYYQID